MESITEQLADGKTILLGQYLHEESIRAIGLQPVQLPLTVLQGVRADRDPEMLPLQYLPPARAASRWNILHRPSQLWPWCAISSGIHQEILRPTEPPEETKEEQKGHVGSQEEKGQNYCSSPADLASSAELDAAIDAAAKKDSDTEVMQKSPTAPLANMAPAQSQVADPILAAEVTTASANSDSTSTTVGAGTKHKPCAAPMDTDVPPSPGDLAPEPVNAFEEVTTSATTTSATISADPSSPTQPADASPTTLVM
uniref:Uncharacterized protein n=1 Tax=Oryza brachyantha TaxID=4533 RepID=J3LQM9_ORYBR